MFGGNQKGSGATGMGNQYIVSPDVSEGVQSIVKAYDAMDMNYGRFRHMFYFRIEAGKRVEDYGKMANVHPKLWEQAMRDNPDSEALIPVQAASFQDLYQRLKFAEERTRQHQEALKAVREKLETLQRVHSVEIVAQISQCQQRHKLLVHRLLQLVAKNEVLRAMGIAMRPQEEDLLQRLNVLLRQMERPSGAMSRFNEVESALQMLALAGHEGSAGDVDEKVVEALYEVLMVQQEGIRKLIQGVHRDRAVVEKMAMTLADTT